MHAHAHKRTHTRTHIFTHKHTHAHMNTHAHSSACTHSLSLTPTHIFPLFLTHTLFGETITSMKLGTMKGRSRGEGKYGGQAEQIYVYVKYVHPVCVRVHERERGREREKRKRQRSERERARTCARERGKVSTKHMKSVLYSLPHPRKIYVIFVHRNSFMNKYLKQTNHIRVCSVRPRVCKCKRH